MNPLDWLLTLMVGYSALRAALRGFVKEAFALGGMVAGLLLACWFYRAGGTALKGLIVSPQLAELAAFVLILVGTAIAASLLGRLISRTVSAVGLGVMDRLAGAAFGVARGALIAGSMLLGVIAFLPTAPWVATSRLAPYFLRAAHAVSFVMPTDLQTRLMDGVNRAKRISPNWINRGFPPQSSR